MEIVMNTSNSRQSYSLYPHKTDAQIQAEFADLVVRACKGDRRAVGAIYVAFGPVLLREARSVMGGFKTSSAIPTLPSRSWSRAGASTSCQSTKASACARCGAGPTRAHARARAGGPPPREAAR